MRYPAAYCGAMSSELLFENPWPLVVVLVGLGAVLRVLGRRRGQPTAVRLSWAAFALAIGVNLLAYSVETTREALIERSGALVEATSPLDPATLERLIAPNATLLGPDGTLHGTLDVPGLVERLERYDLPVNALREVAAEGRGNAAGFSTVDVSSQVNGYPQRTVWRIEWRRDPGADGEPWRAVSFTWLEWNRREPPAELLR